MTTENQLLREAVFTVLEGFTIPHDVRTILETAYYAALTQPAQPAEGGEAYEAIYAAWKGCGLDIVQGTDWRRFVGMLPPLYTTPPASQEQAPAYTYASTQATMCASCGAHKHTPLRIDAMGGYVCLTCIDRKLGSLLGEFGYPEPDEDSQEQAQEPSGGEVVAWRDPSNSDPGQGCTYDKAVHEKWPHIYRQPLTIATPKPQSSGGEVWIQPDHLQKARVAPFLCRVSPTQDAPDFVPLTLATPKPEPMTWQPIETAPEKTGGLVVVRWLDSDGAVCHDLDHTEDGCWMRWHDHAEHVEVIGGHGVSYTPPYTQWLPLSPTGNHGITKEQA